MAISKRCGQQLYVRVAEPVELGAPYRPAVCIGKRVMGDVGESPAYTAQ